MKGYNLLATAERRRLGRACSQLWLNLREVGDANPSVSRTRYRGLLRAKTSLDPEEAVNLLRSHMASSPSKYDLLFRVLPVLSWVPSDLDLIAEEAEKQSARMSLGETYRVTVEKRGTGLRSRELVEAVAGRIDNPVKLVEPDWVVLVEVVGNWTGVSVVKPLATLNIQKEAYALRLKGE